MTRTFAKIVTPDGEFDLSKRAFDEIRMLVTKANTAGFYPNADPPVRESAYRDLEDFLSTHNRDDGYLDEGWYRGPPVDQLEDARRELEELRADVDDEDVLDRLDDRVDELDARIAEATVAEAEAQAFHE